MSCCFTRKLFSRTSREDRYIVKDEGEQRADGILPSNQPQCENRNKVDLSEYVVADIHGAVHKREGINKDAMQIENCTEASILLLKPTASITVDDCRDCLILLGPCSGSVFIRDCSNCVVLACCQQFRTRDCHDIRIGLLCPTQPIIENSTDINFHPLLLNYNDFKNQMCETSLSFFTNRIRSIHDFTPENGKPNFKIHGNPIEFTSDQLKLFSDNQVSTSLSDSLIPYFNSSGIPGTNNINDPRKYMYSFREHDEMICDFTDRATAFSGMLKTSNLKLVASYDIDTSKLESKLLPENGKTNNLIIFELSGDIEEMQKISREAFDLFKILSDEKSQQMTNLIKSQKEN